MRVSFILPGLLILSIVACKKPVHIDNLAASEAQQANIPPLVLYTSLKDSLPEKSLEMLNLHKVQGVKLKFHNGISASYFEYQANKKELLHILSISPFNQSSSIADTLCRSVNDTELTVLKQNITAFEFNNSYLFWQVPIEEYEIYECIKPPLKHTLLLSKKSNNILHRVEFTG